MGKEIKVQSRVVAPLVLNKFCNSCKVTKPRSSFSNRSRTPNGLNYECKDCTSNTNRTYGKTRGGFIKLLIGNSKTSARRRKLPGQHTLTNTQFEAILEKQQNKCFYTGLPLTLERHSHWQASPERLQNSCNYTDTNVVACILEMNTVRQWSKEKVEYAVYHSDTVDATTINKNVAAIRDKTRAAKTQKKCLSRIHDDVIEYRCNKCEHWKGVDQFYKDDRRCKQCMSDIGRSQRTTSWKKVFQLLLNGAAGSSRHRTKKGRTGMEKVELTMEDLVHMYQEQKGCCAYSEIPLTPRGDWKISLERIDVKVGYKVSNCCLICGEFNSPDKSAEKENVTGSCGWSKEKFEFMKAFVKSNQENVEKD